MLRYIKTELKTQSAARAYNVSLLDQEGGKKKWGGNDLVTCKLGTWMIQYSFK